MIDFSFFFKSEVIRLSVGLQLKPVLLIFLLHLHDFETFSFGIQTLMLFTVSLFSEMVQYACEYMQKITIQYNNIFNAQSVCPKTKNDS